MTTRILAQDEYAGRLAGTELEAIWPHLPQTAQVIAVEGPDGRLVACWAVYPLVHAEGCWIAPDQRGNPRVARTLIREMFEAVRRLGAATVQTASVEDHVAALAQRLGGVELPGRHFAVRVR
jgi:hypothetical protein